MPALNGALRVLRSERGSWVRALPRSAWAAGVLLFTSAACAVGDPSSNVAPAIPSSLPNSRPLYSTFTEAADSTYSRILIGFHFRKATEAGTWYGRQIGKRAVNLYLRPIHSS